jgi:hypothetical protein
VNLRAYHRAFVGDALSMAGDWFTYVAVSQLAVADTHGARSALALLSVAASHTLPRVALAPWAGAVCDRVDRRTVLVRAQSVRALIVLTMALLALGPRTTSALAAIHALHLARMSLGAFADTALRSALPDLVGPERLQWAHARSGLAWSALFCLGVALGGVTVAFVGVAAAFAIDAASYAACAALDRSLPPLRPTAKPAEGAREAPAISLLRSLRDDPELARAVGAKVPAALAQGAVWVALTLRAQTFVAQGALALSALHFARGLGAGLGPYALPARPGPSALGARSGSTGLGASWLALAVAAMFAGATGFTTSLLSLFLLGISSGAVWVRSSAAVGRLAPPALRGRISSLELAGQGVAQCAGSALACASLARWGRAEPGVGAALALGALSIAWLSTLRARENRE